MSTLHERAVESPWRGVRTSKGLMAALSSAPTAARVTEDCNARRGMCALFPMRAPATGARFAPTAEAAEVARANGMVSCG